MLLHIYNLQRVKPAAKARDSSSAGCGYSAALVIWISETPQSIKEIRCPTRQPSHLRADRPADYKSHPVLGGPLGRLPHSNNLKLWVIPHSTVSNINLIRLSIVNVMLLPFVICTATKEATAAGSLGRKPVAVIQSCW